MTEEKIILAKTPKSPGVIMMGNIVSIEGRGLPENSIEFFKELKGKLKKELKIKEIYILDLNLPHFSTSFSKGLSNLFKFFKEETKNTKVEWKYEQGDEDTLEYGLDYQRLINLPFKIIKIPSE